MERFKIICKDDNVAVALDDLKAHTFVDLGTSTIEILNDISFGHKFALSNIPAKGKVVKYCEEIGLASTNIKQGEHVHIHNLESTKAKRH